MLKGPIVRGLRRVAWRLLGPPPPNDHEYVGPFGCLQCGASFLAWNQIEGDYLEFGVYKGNSFAEAYRAIRLERRRVQVSIGRPEIDTWVQRRPRFFAFDSFEGLPDGPGSRHLDYAVGAYACSESEFLQNIAKKGVDLVDVITVPGYYDSTLNHQVKSRLSLKRAAMVMVDCDLYESTVPVLDFITDLIGQGTVIIFDDWYRFAGRANEGEQRACAEWLERNPHIELVKYWQQGPQSVAFLVNSR